MNDEQFAELNKRIDTLEATEARLSREIGPLLVRIAELEAEGAWQIRGQPDSELVLVSVHFKHHTGPMWDYYRVLEARWECGQGWREAGGLQIRGHRRVTHWRPLPDPVIPEAHDE